MVGMSHYTMYSQSTHHALLVALLLLASFIIAPCSAINGELSLSDPFPYLVNLDKSFSLQWKFNASHIMFHVNVTATGWVGLGISDHGDMYPGDLVIAWMDQGGGVHFHDRHSTDHVMPEVDKQQDWDLVRLQREGSDVTTMTVVRKLDTCDEGEDMPILDGTTRVIYAYSDTVPGSEADIPYHGATTRGSKSILLLDPPPMDGQGRTMPDDVITVDILNKNYAVPGKDTTYACTILKFPKDLQEKHHLIRFEPVIQAGHERLVHHMLLYTCTNPVPDRLMNQPYECYQNEPEEIDRNCDHVMVAWAIGGTAFDYPKHVGHSLGTDLDPVYFKIETHYDNVQMRNDLVDNSGLRFYLTKQLREHDAGMLEVGSAVDPYHIIPPYMDDFLTRGHCPPACLEEAIGDGEVRVFADFLHSHLIGSRLSTRHIRDGQELPPILKDDHYDFDYQETRALKVERVVKKNDLLMTDCHYDSSDRTTVTFGGLSSRQEMCLSFILYYPRANLTSCFTRVAYTKGGERIYPQGVFNHINQTDWTVKSNREEFATNVQHSQALNECVYLNASQVIWSPRPKVFQEFVPEDRCQDNGAPWMSGPVTCLVAACLVGLLTPKYA